MLSVIVYGRNDGHGNNLAKRAVISLNAIASVLSGDDDEIVFVDYNSPDDLPTFPEAVSDTLTPHARDLMKVVRVRPRHHARYRDHTDLPVIEALSRNIALRRVNDRCRWVLHTNTDMIFNLTLPFASLTDFAASLDDGLYHIPRFELPEALWESFDRQDPESARACLADKAASLGLEVPVLGPSDTIYDYCGDFQLVSRRLLEEIKGFDETMLYRGWCDPNIARRLRMHGHPARSVADAVKGYHCGHHRGYQGGGGRIRNNDAEMYFYFIKDVVPPYQPLDWGMRDVPLETFSLTDRPDFLATAEAYLVAAGTMREPISFPTDRRNSLIYQPGPVLPFLADLLWSQARSSKVALFGVNKPFATIFGDWCRGAGFAAPLVPDAKAESAMVEQADILVVNLGLDFDEARDWSDDALDHALAPMDECLDLLIEVETARIAKGQPPRLFIFINAERALKQGTTYQNQLWFQARLAPRFALAGVPLQSRLSYGYLKASTGKFSLERLAARVADRPAFRRLPLRREMADAFGLLRLLAAEVTARPDAPIAPEYMKPYLLDLAEVALADETCPLPKDALRQISDEGKQRRAHQTYKDTLLIPLAETRPAPRLAGFANYFSWDDQAWAAWADRFGGEENANVVTLRSGHFWGQIQMLYALDQLGLFSADSHLAVHAEDCGRMVQMMADRVGKVRILGSIEQPFGVACEARAGSLVEAVPSEGADVAISFMHPKDTWGVLALVPTLCGLANQTRLGGVLMHESDVRLTETVRISCPDARHYCSGAYQDILARSGGIDLVPEADFSFDTVSFDSQSRQTAGPMFPRIVTNFPNNLLVAPAVTVWRKVRSETMEGWRSAQLAVMALEDLCRLFPAAEEGTHHQLESRQIPMFEGSYRFAFEAVANIELTMRVFDHHGSEVATRQSQAGRRHELDYAHAVSCDMLWSPIVIKLETSEDNILMLEHVSVALAEGGDHG